MSKDWVKIGLSLRELIAEIGPIWPDSTQLSGFATDGPYHCSDCEYLNDSGNRCNHPIVMMDPEVEHDKYGLGVIKLPDKTCCEFVEPK